MQLTKNKAKKKRNVSKSEAIVHGIIIVLLLLFTLLCLLPFINILASSFATSGELSTRPFILIPKTFTLDAYRYILSTPTIFKAIGISLFVTTVGTFISMVATSFMAYALSRKYLHGRKFFNFIIVFTMLFSGGMIPSFILIKSLGLIDSLWALILPSIVSAYNMIIMRNFFQGIPDSLEESAKMDGCTDWGVFLRIILPLSLPSIATISLFYAVEYWNTYQPALLYINDSSKWPIQVLLRQIVIVSSGMNADASTVDIVPPAQSVKMAVIIIATLPMLIIYPFIQKYFVKGAMVGSVKG
ncbi:carbohydrate ABC transporter permease [Melissococcus plutonius]|uniref:ABC transporter permease protein YtcP n=1 Tax=Melissococcus plutonius TaxID=33970 RepID=A0A2Z5Y3T0_9ENTE|nr:carbohydrate ABC transporter permease [Melissococcus plutonius]BAL62641.1 putative ABC transporter permease YtcP [Melissococcus plutonius DAT561]MCV2498566.1 carbohydrate ABC transporter permease [Melissococcus plutonius]MCV2501753.1 carbohydrate ABC transporter permease [Melissococcus plutonius]MCV2504766.1 carbohydrate ABC transporter permease [Melissococcus plutonius]MCV2507226.1 carbohydrate ABC transporter permease [Melissococcus plutonius]